MKQYQINLIIVITIVATVMILIIIPILIILTINSVTFEGQPALSGTYNLYGDSEAVQQFYSDRENLHAIGLSIRNPAFSNTEDISLDVIDESGTVQRSTILSGINISDGAFVKFVFEPIEASLNKEYFAVFKSPGSTQENLLGLFMTSQNPPWLGTLMVNNEIRDTKIALVRYYKPASKYRLITDLISNFITKVTYDLHFFSIYLLILGIIYWEVVQHKNKT